MGDGMPTAEAGSNNQPDLNPVMNPEYDPATGAFDHSSVAYSDAVRISAKDLAIPGSSPAGGRYGDADGNGKPDWESDIIAYPMLASSGTDTNAIYSERLRSWADFRHLIPLPPPPHIPALAETRAFWRWRNGELWIDKALRWNPNLMFLVLAFDSDHVRSAPDHPRVLIQYEGFRSGGAAFERSGSLKGRRPCHGMARPNPAVRPQRACTSAGWNRGGSGRPAGWCFCGEPKGVGEARSRVDDALRFLLHFRFKNLIFSP